VEITHQPANSLNKMPLKIKETLEEVVEGKKKNNNNLVEDNNSL